MLHQVGAREPTRDREERMVAADDCNHLDHKNRFDAQLARYQTSHAELRVVDRELRVCREKRVLPEPQPNMREAARETRQGIKQALGGENAVHREL